MNQVQAIKEWFERAVPQPTTRSRAVQLGVHYEEVSEMATATGDSMLAASLTEAANDYKLGRTVLQPVDRVELLDSLCDQMVTAIGVAHMYNMDIVGALGEVNRSNWSKFVDGQPIFDVNGKIKKGPAYFKPSLIAYAGQQSA